jgi:hypothetical protein
MRPSVGPWMIKPSISSKGGDHAHMVLSFFLLIRGRIYIHPVYLKLNGHLVFDIGRPRYVTWFKFLLSLLGFA